MNVLTGLRYSSCEQVMQIVANNAAKVDLSFAIRAARVECHRLACSLLPAAVADAMRELVSEILRVAISKIDIALCKAYE
jgi:hypothetical protein